MFNKVTKSIQYGAHTLTLETGEISRQADAAVFVETSEACNDDAKGGNLGDR